MKKNGKFGNFLNLYFVENWWDAYGIIENNEDSIVSSNIQLLFQRTQNEKLMKYYQKSICVLKNDEPPHILLPEYVIPGWNA